MAVWTSADIAPKGGWVGWVGEKSQFHLDPAEISGD